MDEEPLCHLCGCEESAHYGEEIRDGEAVEVCTGCGEPCPFEPSAAEMDEFIVAQWNATVRPQDHVYHLGDVAMRKPHLQTVKRLNGHKRLVWGNHDIFDYKDYVAAGFQKLYGIRVLDNMILTHIPVHCDSLGRFGANIHGHIHEKPCHAGAYVNVSVEATGYRPLSLEEAKARIPTPADAVILR